MTIYCWGSVFEQPEGSVKGGRLPGNASRDVAASVCLRFVRRGQPATVCEVLGALSHAGVLVHS